MESRLTALEEQVMFLERHVQQLDEHVRSLGDDLTVVRREISVLRHLGTTRYEDLLERIEQADGDAPAAGDPETPPTTGDS